MGLLALLGSLFGGLFNGIGNIFAGQQANEANLQATRETNAANLQAVRETNAANVEQANLAYERSKPQNQLLNLMSTGLSRQGALNIMNGTNGGVYTAPTLQSGQSQAPHFDMSHIASAFDKLGNIPSNVVQMRLQNQQYERIEEEMRLQREKFDMERKALEERLQRERDEELRKQYGQNAVEMTDKLTAKIGDLAAKYGVKFADLRSEDDLVDKLHLQEESLWRSAPASARQTAIDAARQRYNDWLSMQTENREQLSAKDAHQKALDDLKNSEFGRTLTHNQINKLKADTELIWQQVDDYKNSENARTREYAAREARAKFEKIMSDFNIVSADFKNSAYWTVDSNGDIHPTDTFLQKKGVSEAWKFIGTFLGADLLQEILHGLVTFAK